MLSSVWTAKKSAMKTFELKLRPSHPSPLNGQIPTFPHLFGGSIPNLCLDSGTSYEVCLCLSHFVAEKVNEELKTL